MILWDFAWFLHDFDLAKIGQKITLCKLTVPIPNQYLSFIFNLNQFWNQRQILKVNIKKSLPKPLQPLLHIHCHWQLHAGHRQPGPALPLQVVHNLQPQRPTLAWSRHRPGYVEPRQSRGYCGEIITEFQLPGSGCVPDFNSSSMQVHSWWCM